MVAHGWFYGILWDELRHIRACDGYAYQSPEPGEKIAYEDYATALPRAVVSDGPARSLRWASP
jgi:hypothetical protein